jgi:hypothetical protein
VQEEVRFVVVHSSQLAQQQAQASAAAHVKEAEAVADHVRQVHTWWCACRPDAGGPEGLSHGIGQGDRQCKEQGFPVCGMRLKGSKDLRRGIRREEHGLEFRYTMWSKTSRSE